MHPTGTVPDPALPSLERVRSPAGSLALCLLLVAIPFLGGLAGGFVYDDLAMVVRNPRITSFSHLPEILTRPMLDFLDPETARQVGYWRPVAGLALTLGHTLGGGSPLGFHIVSLALHLLATAVTFRLARRLFRSDSTAFFVALLFGIHPTHVEGVSWISAINDPLFGLFSLLSIDAFVAWRDGGSRSSAWRAALWLVPALLSKEMAAAVAPMALAVDLGRRRVEGVRPFWRAYGPMAIAVVLYYLARVAVFGDLLAGFDRVTTNYGVPALRLFQARFELLGGFLWLLVWPADLNLFRPFRPELPFADPQFLRALACILVLAAGIWFSWKRRLGPALVALLLIPAAAAPALVRMQSLGTFPLSDRFLYLATLGLALLAAWSAFTWLPRRVAIAALSLVAIAYGGRIMARMDFWRDEESLFSTAVVQSPRSPYVHWGYSRVLLQNYRESKRVEVLREAHAQAQEALDLLAQAQKGDGSIFATRDDHVQSNLCLAWCLLYEAEIDPYHDYSTALRVFSTIAERYPENAYAQTGVGVAAMQLGRLKESEAALKRALELNPKYPEAHHNLGILRLRREDPRGAAESFEAALENRPDVLDDLLWLARARLQAGERQSALAALARAKDRHPRSAGPLVLEATIAAQEGKVEDAYRLVSLALERNPDDGEALLLKSKVLLARGEMAGAMTALVRATEILPTSFEAHYNTAALKIQKEGVSAAMPYLFRAYVLRPDSAEGRVLRDQLLQLPIDDTDRLARFAAIDADRGDPETAIRWLDKALAKQPAHGPSLYLKGVLVLKSGDRDEAETWLRKACDAMPGSFDAHQELGMLLADEGRPKEALPFLEKALELAESSQGTNPDAAAGLDLLREAIVRVREAAR
ncbi:MAG: tetratricopeptide repeat protein [Planctomycetota bacterium]